MKKLTPRQQAIHDTLWVWKRAKPYKKHNVYGGGWSIDKQFGDCPLCDFCRTEIPFPKNKIECKKCPVEQKYKAGRCGEIRWFGSGYVDIAHGNFSTWREAEAFRRRVIKALERLK